MKLCTHFILVYTIMIRIIIMNINNRFYSFLLIFTHFYYNYVKYLNHFIYMYELV
mgnify:FL=1